jgi:hypothetical protein
MPLFSKKKLTVVELLLCLASGLVAGYVWLQHTNRSAEKQKRVAQLSVTFSPGPPLSTRSG